MMRSLRCIGLAALLGALVAGVPARAVVTYGFVANVENRFQTFTYESRDYIVGGIDLSPADLRFCGAAITSCDGVSILQVGDLVRIDIFETDAFSLSYIFPAARIDRNGLYSTPGNAVYPALLSILGAPDLPPPPPPPVDPPIDPPGVPEPTSWALLLIGFGLVGAALRRRAPAILRR